jgi:hypothetical protein
MVAVSLQHSVSAFYSHESWCHMIVKFSVITFVSLPLLSSEALQQRGRIDTARRNGTEVAVVGCLKREADVPGRRDSAAERLGIGRDFVLTEVRMLPAGAASSSSSSGQKMAPASLDAIKALPASDARYYVIGLGAEALEPHVNQLVALEGRVDDDRVGVTRGPQDTGSAATSSPGHFEPTGRTSSSDAEARKKESSAEQRRPEWSRERAGGELPKIAATSIRSMAGSCGAVPKS